MPDEDPILERIRIAAASLGEHCAAVQILASWPCEGGGTASHFFGTGDWYARQGLAQAFVHRDQNEDLAQELARTLDL